jgi:hypothetical protein
MPLEESSIRRGTRRALDWAASCARGREVGAAWAVGERRGRRGARRRLRARWAWRLSRDGLRAARARVGEGRWAAGGAGRLG